MLVHKIVAITPIPTSAMGKFSVVRLTTWRVIFDIRLRTQGATKPIKHLVASTARTALVNNNATTPRGGLSEIRSGVLIEAASAAALPLPAPAEQPQRTEANGDERECAREGGDGWRERSGGYYISSYVRWK